MLRQRFLHILGASAMVAPSACTQDATAGHDGFGVPGGTADDGGADDGGGDGDGTDDGGADDGGSDDGGDDGSDTDDGGIKFDTPVADVGGSEDVCEVGEMDAVPECEEEAPPDAFTEAIQWTWPGENEFTQAIVTPLVVNLNDDDGSGDVDLCDVPDVIVTVLGYDDIWHSGAHIFALDGETGGRHWKSSVPVWGGVTPALGDIDGDEDGIAEIVTIKSPTGASLAAAQADKPLIALDANGDTLWEGDMVSLEACDSYCAIALADLDNDGGVEILVGHLIFDANGTLIRALPDANPTFSSWHNLAPTAVDLDGDDDLEVLLGRSAYHHDGEELFFRAEIERSSPHVADFDGDELPEILLFNDNGISMLEADGTPIFTDLRPTGDYPTVQDWMRPAMIHDIDGDNVPEFAASTGSQYNIYDANATVIWSSPIDDYTGAAGSTAFDFLGDGTAEAMYADHDHVYIYDELGNVLLQSPRSSKTYYEYPVVADVDNDGSAEIVHVSSENFDGQQTAPTVQVVRDEGDRWVQARRIWNQHTYHVTNVREDGTIPEFEKAHWTRTNTFRTQAQIGESGICDPPG
jgi:hypothetical protein